jgi:hypothetical protein
MLYRILIDNDPTKAGLRVEQATAESRLHRVCRTALG